MAPIFTSPISQNAPFSPLHPSIIKFVNCTLCDKGILQEDGTLWINCESGIILPPQSESVEHSTIDLEGLILAPGFIDIQINGCFGFDFSSLASTNPIDVIKYKNEYNKVMAQLLKTGVTSVCPTITSNFSEVYQSVLPVLKPERLGNQAESLGAHIEGPFLSPLKPGCHPRECIVDAPKGFESFSDMYGKDNFSNIRIITAAPEIRGVMEAIPEIVEKGVIFSTGHTTASYEIAHKACENGGQMITHLYNAMPQPHHRHPGVFGLIGAPKTGNFLKPYFGLVADGIHVHPSTVNIAYYSDPDKICLVTDAIKVLGCEDGIYPWGNQFLEKKDNEVHLKNTNTIAGSATLLPQCLRNLIEWSSTDLPKAIKTVTNNPALSVGIENKKGFLNPNCDADLTILDQNGIVKHVFKLGKQIL